MHWRPASEHDEAHGPAGLPPPRARARWTAAERFLHGGTAAAAVEGGDGRWMRLAAASGRSEAAADGGAGGGEGGAAAGVGDGRGEAQPMEVDDELSGMDATAGGEAAATTMAQCEGGGGDAARAAGGADGDGEGGNSVGGKDKLYNIQPISKAKAVQRV